jgi:hypothetical protein
MNKKIIATIGLIVTLEALRVVPSLAQPYDFPVKPGMAVWKSFSTYSQMVQVCQIPAPVLNSLSTSALLETCLNYPIAYDLLAFESKQRGFDRIVKGFNGLQELLRRNDVGSIAIAKYKSMDPEAIDSKRKWSCSYEYFLMELILAQDTILSRISNDERQLLLKDAYLKFLSKGRRSEIFAHIACTNNVLLMGRLLEKNNDSLFTQTISQNPRLKKNLLDASLRRLDDMSQIVNISQKRLGIN